jgi:chromate transporter
VKPQKNKLFEIALVFFKLGCFAFGGPAAHIAMMESEVVDKRKWMSREHFLDLIGATNLIPGPNSTEMTMHCGHERAGFSGLFLAGVSFIFPAVFITGLLGYLYVSYGSLPEVEPFVQGIKPAVLAIIAAAIVKLGKKALKGWELALLGAIVFGVCLAGVNEVLALLGAGIIGGTYFYARNRTHTNAKKNVFTLLLISSAGTGISKLSISGVFFTFLKVGAVLYGSGYVLFAYLDAELVEAGWMTRQELLDAIAVGQFTPGPVLSTATFIGYQLTGFWGALAATAGIFLPSFLFVLLLNPLVPKMRKSIVLRGFLDAVNVAAVSVMAAVLLVMSWETLVDWKSIAITMFGTILTFWFKKVSVVWTILGGSVLGFLFSFL